MIYKNARIVTTNKQIHGYIELDEHNNIIKIAEGDCKTGFDCQNKIIMPGFIDTHTHGGYGMSFDDFTNDSEFISNYQKYLTNLAKEGVVAFVPTNVSLSLAHLETILNNVHKFLNANKTYVGPSMVGWFFEGPFISIKKKGAHDERVIIPVDESFMQKAKTMINLPIVIAIAPEIEHNLEMIEKYSKDYIFALGHSNCDYNQAVAAFKAGAKRVIHLYNAMSGFSHRDMGIVNAVFNQTYLPDVNVELISDGQHTANEVIQTTDKIVSHDNLCIVSDCLAAKGLQEGTYMLGTLAIDKRGDFFYLKDSNTLAGGGAGYNKVANHYKQVTNCKLSDLVKLTSANAVKNLNLRKNLGDLKLHAPANLIMVDDSLNVYLNISEGKIVYEHK